MQDYIGVRPNSYDRIYVPAERVHDFRAKGGRLLKPTTQAESGVRARILAPLRTLQRPTQPAEKLPPQPSTRPVPRVPQVIKAK